MTSISVPLPRRLAFNLRELILANNTGLFGRLPDEAAGLPHLHRVGLAGTGLSCKPNDSALAEAEMLARGLTPPVYRCADKQLLPCFLEFSPFSIPRGDASHMACRPIKYKPHDAVVADCPPAALVSSPDSSQDVLEAQWDLPPSYYQFQGCTCLDGWVAEWSRDGTELRCIVDKRSALPAWTWVLVGLGVVLLLIGALLAVLGSRWVLLHSRWMREMELKRKRKLGLPRDGGVVSVVITDIEGFSSERLWPLGTRAPGTGWKSGAPWALRAALWGMCLLGNSIALSASWLPLQQPPIPICCPPRSWLPRTSPSAPRPDEGKPHAHHQGAGHAQCGGAQGRARPGGPRD